MAKTTSPTQQANSIALLRTEDVFCHSDTRTHNCVSCIVRPDQMLAFTRRCRNHKTDLMMDILFSWTSLAGLRRNNYAKHFKERSRCSWQAQTQFLRRTSQTQLQHMIRFIQMQ